MRKSAIYILATEAVLLLCGCTNFMRKLSQSDSALDFAMALSGREHTEAFPVQLQSRGAGRIATGHVHKDAKGLLIFGTVEKRGPGWVSAAWSHVDVVVVDGSGRVLSARSTKFSPSWVPSTQRGIVGRSRYFVGLSSIPPLGSFIQVTFHQQPIARCSYRSS